MFVRFARTLVVMLGLVMCVAGLVATPARAAVSQAFAIRKQVNDHGDILLRGNSLLTCPASSTCTPARDGNDSGTPANLNNNSYSMQFVDIDNDSTTASSSSAQVTLPSGATVAWAGLYWSGYTANAGSRILPPAGTTQNQLKLMTPASSAYTTVTASSVYNGTTAAAEYSAFADVTGMVQGGGSGTYTGANIFADSGPDSYAAWTLVIITNDPAQPKRNLTVFDGFGVVQQNDTSATVVLNGFQTPSQGTVSARLGAVTYEGDAGLTGENFTVTPQGGSASALTNALNPGANQFNSTVSDAGTTVAGRNPSDSNTFGYDADVYDASLLFSTNQTSATLTFSTGGETFFPAVATFAVNIYAPDLSLVRSSTVADANSDNRTRPGDRIDYTVDVTNSNGNSSTDSANTVITDTLPGGVTYVPGSLQVDGVSVTDGADSDRAEISGNTLTVRLGTGAGGSTSSGGTGSGGTLAKGAHTRVTYSVVISGTYTGGGAITSSTATTYDSPTTSTHFTGTSNTDSVTVDAARSDLAVTNVAAPALVQRDGTRNVVWTATVRNNGPDSEPSPVLMQALPAGTTATVSGATCTGGPTFSCNLAALASGTSVQVIFTGTLPSGAADPSLATATLSGSNQDPASGNNTGTASVAVNIKPAAVADAATLPSARLVVDADVLANDSDPDGDPISLQSVGTPAHGTATVVNGKLRYRLTDLAFTGTDTVTYTVCDNRSGCSTQNLAVSVADHSVADLGVALTASPALVQRDGSRVVTWTAKVTDAGPSADPAPVLTQTLPAGVTAVQVDGATCSSNGTTYTCPLAALDVGDTDTVTFTAILSAGTPDPSSAAAGVTGSLTDANQADNTASARVAVNTPPSAVADSGTLSATATKASIDVLANDTDADRDQLSLTKVGKASHGSVAISAGKVLYTLTDTSFEGDDMFTYTVCDDRSGCSEATVTMHLTDRDHAPRAVADSAKTTKGQPVLIGVLTNDTDSDGDSLALAKITSRPGHGTVTIREGEVLYTPEAGFVGADSFRYQVCDPGGACDTATVHVTVTNLPPVANADSATVKPGGTAVVDVLRNDTDPDGGTLGRVTIVKQPSAGTAFVDAQGRIHYTAPRSGVDGGIVTLSYRTCDASGACSTGTLTFAVAKSGTRSADSSGENLAFTGAQVLPLLLVGVALFLGGIALLRASRPRRPALSWRSYEQHGHYRTTPPADDRR